MNMPYADWLYHQLIAERTESDPDALRRAVLLLTAGVSTIGDGEPSKRLFRAKIGSLPFIQDLVSQDPTLLERLQLPLLQTRYIDETTLAPTSRFVEAVASALRGQLDVTLTDTKGQICEIRQVTLLATERPFKTVAFAFPDGRIHIANDFRLQYLTLFGEDIGLQFYRDRANLDMTPEEREAAAALMGSQSPELRLRALDELLRNRFSVFLLKIHTKVASGMIESTDLRPPSAKEAMRFLGGADNREVVLAERISLSDTLVRLTALPIPLPKATLDRFFATSRAERRAIFRNLENRARSPFPAMHYLRLALREAASLPTQSRLLKKTLRRFLSAAQLESFLDYARWCFVELQRRPPSYGTIEENLLTAWLTSTELCNLARSFSLEPSELFDVVNFHGQSEIFYQSVDEATIPSSPTRVRVLDLGLRFLGHVFQDVPEQIEGLSNIIDAFVLRSDSPWPLHIDLYPPLTTHDDPLHSVFAEPMTDLLERLLGARFTPSIRNTFSVEFALAICNELAAKPTWWHFLQRRTLGGSVPSNLVDAIFEQFTRAEDVTLLQARPNDWSARLLTFVQALSEDYPGDLSLFLQNAAASIQNHPEAEQLARKLIKAKGISVSHTADRVDRLASVVSYLALLIHSPDRHIRRAAWDVAVMFRNRLAAHEVTFELSRVILIGRQMA